MLRRREKRSLNNNSFLGEYECSSLALNRGERRDKKKRLDHLKQDQAMLVTKRFSERKKKGVLRFKNKGKLIPRFIGPFKILKRVGEVAYVLELPKEMRDRSKINLSRRTDSNLREEIEATLQQRGFVGEGAMETCSSGVDKEGLGCVFGFPAEFCELCRVLYLRVNGLLFEGDFGQQMVVKTHYTERSWVKQSNAYES
ncbi:hypothetical protein Tco_0185729 [Tanacetum coccineum]